MCGTPEKITRNCCVEFSQGLIKLNGEKVKKVNDTLLIEFTRPRIACVTMKGPLSSKAETFSQIGRDGEGNYFNGQIHEILVWDRKLTDTEVENVESYLKRQW
jgi:hypothetical protein